MINIDKFRTFVHTVSNKNGRGTLTPEQFNSVTERALYAWTNNQVSNQKQYQIGNPIPQSSLDLDTISQDKIRHLKELRTIRVTNGEAQLPNGINTDINTVIMPKMWMRSKLAHKYANNGVLVRRPIDIKKDMEWELNLSSSIMAPTVKRAIANLQSDHILIEPISISLVTLSYIRNPNTPVWAYNMVSDRPSYDSSASTDLDAPESAFNEIAMIVLEFIGIKIREAELVQAAAGLENKGV